MPGIEALLRGILRYRIHTRGQLLEQFKRVKDNPANKAPPTAIFFTCIDSRVLASRFTDSNVGENFIVRSAGNLIPHACHFGYETATTEAGALELGCIITNSSKDVVVCGHSDCKAINLLYSIRDKCHVKEGGPLQLWLKRHGVDSLTRFNELSPSNNYQGPLTFAGETPKHNFTAYIDPENKFCIEDKLSQVSCLQQIQNIASYPFLREKLETEDVKLHAMWFDIYTGEVFMFSRTRERFVQITEQTFDHLLGDARRKHTNVREVSKNVDRGAV